MSEKGLYILFYIYVCLVVRLCANIDGSSVEVPPSDKVVSAGDNTQFFCKIDADPQVEAVAWKRRVLGRDKTVEDIFHTWPPDGKKIDEAKYTFTENDDNPLETSITVKNVAFTDAGRYSCEPTSHADGAMYGILVVVGTPKIRLPMRLTEGQEAELVCEVRYLGPPQMMEAGLEPHIVTRVGDKVLHGNVVRRVPADPSQPYVLRAVYKTKVNSTLHKLTFSCDVQVHSPAIDYDSTASRTLRVDFPVRNVKLSPAKNVYSTGDSVSCTAEGYPKPVIRWEMMPTRGTSGHSSVLNISHRWVCVATNVVGRVTRHAKSPIVTYIDPTAVSRKEYTLAIILLFVGLLVGASAMFTGYYLASRKNRRRQSSDLPVVAFNDAGTDAIPMSDLAQKKEPDEPCTATPPPNQPLLHEFEACEVLDIDDPSKGQPQSAVSGPSSSVTTLPSTELSQPIGEPGSMDGPLCDVHQSTGE